MRLGIGFIASAACLTQAVLAEPEALPTQILPVAIANLEATTTLLLDLDTEAAETGLSSSDEDAAAWAAHDLKLRARAKDEEKDEDEEETKSSYHSGSKHSKEDDDEGEEDDKKSSKSKATEDEDEDKDEKKSSSSKEDDDDDDEKDDKKSSSSSSKSKQEEEEEDNDDDEKSEKSEKTGTMTLSVSATQSTDAPTMSTLPVAFDDKKASDFKTQGEDDSCPNFIENLLGSDEFKRCYPLSMMVRTSNSFFQAQKNLVSIVRVLDATCAADVKECTKFMNSAAQNLTSKDNCETEFNDGFSPVMQAYRGLMAYEMMYTATCLQDPDSENYCFATAVSNTSTISDTYLYFLPYNWSLPGSSTPSCDWCVQETMGIFHSATANRKQLIATTYESAARQVNTVCGSAYVNETVADESESFAVISAAPSVIMLGTSLLLGATLNVML